MLTPHTVLGLGIWLIALNLIGIPSVWKMRLYALTGLVLVGVYLVSVIKVALIRFAEGASGADTFTQNGQGSGQTTNKQ